MIRTPSMQDALLAGIPGRGIITRLRDAQDDVVEANGTFAPEGAHTDLSALRLAQQSGQWVRYEGLVTDGQGQGERDELATVEVSITRIQEYVDLDGERRLLVNFLGTKPREHGVTGFERQRGIGRPGRTPVPPEAPRDRVRKELRR